MYIFVAVGGSVDFSKVVDCVIVVVGGNKVVDFSVVAFGC